MRWHERCQAPPQGTRRHHPARWTRSRRHWRHGSRRRSLALSRGRGGHCSRQPAAVRSWHRLGPRVHDRLGDRRHLTLFISEEADGLHRALPARLPVRRQGLPRSGLKERTEVPALVTHRGRCARVESSHLQGSLRQDQGPPRSPTRRQGRAFEVARKLTEAIWHMLQTGSMFAPARSHTAPLVA